MNDALHRISANPRNYRPVMTNHFEMTIHGLDGMKNWADEEGGTITDSDITLKIATRTWTGPKISQQSVSIAKYNLTMEFPGRIDAFESSATFDVFVDKSAWDILYSWKMQSGNQETGDVGDPWEYWKNIDVDVLTGNKNTLVGTWNLSNCWLSSLQDVTFDNNANEIKTATITIKYFSPKWRSAKGNQ